MTAAMKMSVEAGPAGGGERWTVRPATTARWGDIETLFGERGACGGCWCMAWRLRTKEWTAGKGARNRRAFRAVVTSGEVPGLLGYLGRRPVAWCALAPRETYSFLARSRVLRPVDDRPVWSVSCLFVLRPCRRMGLSVRMLRAAVDFAARRGAAIIEGYPVQPTMARTPDPFIWTGVPSAFRKAGFREVARRSETRPIMRYEVARGGKRRPERGGGKRGGVCSRSTRRS